MRLRGVLLAIALVAAAPGTAAADAAGLPVVLDVVDIATLLEGGKLTSAPDQGLWADGPDLLGLREQSGMCQLVRIPGGRALAEPYGDPIDCGPGHAARMVGFDAASGLRFVCVDGEMSTPLLRAYDAAGRQAWVAGPDLGASFSEFYDTIPDGVPVPQIPPEPGDASPVHTTWSCPDAEVFGGLVYVAFGDSNGLHQVRAIQIADPTGAGWKASIPASRFSLPDNPVVQPNQTDPPNTGLPIDLAPLVPVFTPTSIVATASGVVVSGRIASGPGGAAWFDWDGNLMGTAALTTAPSTGNSLPHSRGLATDGRLAAGLIDGQLFVVDPQKDQGSFVNVGAVASFERTLAASRWGSEGLLVPGQSRLFLRESGDPSAVLNDILTSEWKGLDSGQVQDVLAGPPGKAQVLVSADRGGIVQADLVTVDLGTGESTGRVPLRFAQASPGLAMHLNVLSDGSLLAWDASGHGAVLGVNRDLARPALTVETDYPEVGAPFGVHVARGEAASANATLYLAWDRHNGNVEAVQDGARLDGSFDKEGPHTLRLTAVYPDGRTATATHVVFVGAEEPRENLFDTAFAQENQNYTFFAIGLFLSALGALLALLGRHKGRNRMEREFRLLDKVREDGRRDPFGAVRGLHEYREHLRDALTRGRLEEPQYTVLEAAAGGVLELLRQRILGGFIGRVSSAFSHTLDLALQDGTIDEGEAKSLLGQAHKEPKLTADEKKRLEFMVRSWQRSIG